MARWLGLAGIVWAAIYFTHVTEVQAAKKTNQQNTGKSSYSKGGTFSKHGSNEPRYECVEPVGPIHGSIMCYSEEIQKKCIVSCDEGYHLRGAFTEKEIVCSYNSGHWFPPKVPECIPSTSDYGANEGSHDIPSQFSGHEMGGTQEVERLSDMCSNPSPPPFSTITCGDIYEGRKCLVRCYSGYVLKDRASQFMTECFLSGDRTWHPPLSDANCSPDPYSRGSHNEYEGAGSRNTLSYGLCKNISTPMNGRYGCTFGSKTISCNATCLSGYHFRISPPLSAIQISCQKLVGQWSPMDTFPDCVRANDWNKNTDGTGIVEPRTKPEDLCQFPEDRSIKWSCTSYYKIKKCIGTCPEDLHFRITPPRTQIELTCDVSIGKWMPFNETPKCISSYPDCGNPLSIVNGRHFCRKRNNSSMDCIGTCYGFNGEKGLFEDGSENKTLICRKGIWENGKMFPKCKGMGGYGTHGGDSYGSSSSGGRGHGSSSSSNRGHPKACGDPTHTGGVTIRCDSANELDTNRECKGTCSGGEYKRHFADMQYEHKLTCKNGEWWNGSIFPPCARKSGSSSTVQTTDLCELPPGPYRGTSYCNNTTVYKTCVALCIRNYGFKHGGQNETISCKLSDGKWLPKSTFSNCIYICDPRCKNGGRCIDGSKCLCSKEYRGRQCQYPISNCDEGKIQFSGTVSCQHMSDMSKCELTCPPGYQLDASSNIITCDLAGNLSPAVSPKCKRIYSGGSGHIGGSTNEMDKNKSPSDAEWEIVRPDEKPGYEWGEGHGNKRPPFELATSQSTGVCAVWSTYHYRTFDGFIYDYAGSCSYILAKDNLTNVFSIILEHDSNCVNRRVRSGTKCFRTVKIKLVDAVYQLYAGPGGVVLSENGRHLPIPYTHGINVEYIARYIVVTLYQDTMVWIDRTDAIYVVVNENFKKGLLGLCGNYDDNHNNDMLTPSGTVVKKAATFGNSWKVQEAGVCEDVQDEAHTEICRHDSSEDDKIAETAAARCLNINEEEYKYCHDFVDPKLYIEACKIDCCDQKGLEGCECSSFSEYFRECARLMNNKYTAWRKPALCPMKCENGTKYQDCGSACPTTCGAPELPCTIISCVDGCHCPEGMALHEKQCVPVNECPCQHNDHWYAHGTLLEINCRTCLCQGGNWECTNNICPALCSSTGDSHFTTFDGKRYNFVGYCSYYLVHQEDGYIVEQESSDCIGDIGEYEVANHKESIISCKKTVILKTPQGTIVKLKQGMEVTVNSREVNYLPHLAPGVSIRQLTSLYQEAEFDNGLKILWDGWTRIYVIAPTTLYGKVQGLCGTFNNFQNDDFITPAGDQEKSVKFFAEKWKVPTGCHDVLSHNVLISSPCDIYPHHQKEAEKICSKIKSDIFKDCKAVIDPEPFYRNCLYDVCSCKSEISSCFCSSLANYALVCARSNASIDWRPHVPNCGLRCIGRQQYQTYIKTCEYSCRQIATLPECETEYVEGCACPSGETLDANGNCVSIFECPCIYHNHEYVPNFVQRRGTKTCTCIKGRWQCHPSSVEELLTTPPSEVLTCLASDHKEYTDCLSDCPITCSNLHDPPTCTMLSCKSGCRCQQGYVLNEDGGVCVKPKDCPCHHGKRSYKDKEKIRIDCKECVCDKGNWKCDKHECPGLCSSWGNSHFMTFDSHFYDFQGTCEYVLASGKIPEKETFSIIIQNEKCGSRGITCSKIISFAIGNDRITFSKNGPSPRINPDSRFSIKEVGMFVYVATDIGIYLQWDKGTRVYIHALPIWSGKLKGLCGDFNGDGVDDFKQPSGNIPATQAVDFANSWKMHPYCEKPMDIPDSCIFHSERRDWALKKCKVLRSFIFSECHSEVDLEPYYESCVFDTCACDMGGDCECLCTAIAAYAYECARNGIYVYWRSQELCPIQCEDCDHYSPCISTCSPETCHTLETGDTENVEKPCLEEPCSEGCERNKCPQGQVYNNTNDYKCIPKEECIVLESQYFCKNLNGRNYKIGELINDPEFSDQCRTCYCTRFGPECTGFPCTSSPYAPTVVPEKSVCTSGWSEWLNFSSPNFEKTYHPMCPVYQISNIECRPMQSINDAECSLENGLNCLNGDYQVTQLCSKYKIRVHCDCDDYEEEEDIEHTEEPETSTSVPPTACGLPMYTDWMNVDDLNIGTLQQLMYELRRSYTFCDDDDVLSVECDISSKPGISHNKLNRKIRKCVASDGSLICGLNSNFKKHCIVRVLCNCVIKDLQLPNVTCLEKTPWIDFDDPDDGIDFESIHRIPAIEKLCPKITSTRCRTLHNNSTRPPPATKFNIRCTGGEVACKTDSRHTCPDYAVISTCRCTKRPVLPNPPPKGSTWPSVVTLPPGTKKPVPPVHPLKESTLLPGVCPSGAWDNCATDCQQTCKPFRNELFQLGICTKEKKCVSGCQKAKCLYPNVWRDANTCILERDCPCMTEAGDIVGPGQVLVINECETCHCLNNYMNCIVMASCTTGAFNNSLHYTGESIIQDDCWTRWMNSDNPSLGSGDFEKLSVLQQKYKFCSNPIEVQCRDAITKRDSKDIYQDVTCNKEEGLICWNNRTRCNDYEIRFFCPCSAITPLHDLEVTATTAPQVCQQGWSVWFNNHTADNTGDYESLQLAEGNSGNKICVDGTISSVNCRRIKDGLSYSLTNQYVTCELEKGLLCENSKQTRGEKCHDYEISFFCDCFDQTTPKVTPTSAYRVPSPTSAFNYSGVNEEEHLPYTTPVPTAVHECWEFVPLINGEQKLPDSNLKASSRQSSEFGAQKIRISTDPNKHSGKAWIPAALNKDQYVEIDLSEPRLIYGIITQGREDYQEWVTSYYLLYSNDRYLFTQYKDPHSPEKVIPGNYDSRSLVKVIFDVPFEARYIRIQPNTWEGQIALRVELLGCSKISDETKDLKVYVCLEPMGLENGKLSDLQLTAPSQHDWSHTPSDGRIGGNGWVAAESDDKQYLQVDFLDSRVISAIVTQGRENENQWVSAYMVSYSNDGNTWTVIADEQDQSKLKIFSANYDDKHLVTNYLPRSLRTRYIRIMPVKWKNWISMKMEILGCYHPYREIVTTTIGEIIYALPKEKVTPSTQCLQPMGLSSSLNDLQSLPDELISVSSSEPGAGAPRLRLNTKASGRKKGGWIPKSWDKNPSVKIDFLIPSTLTSITTKGIEGTGRKINSYEIFVSNDSYNWNPVYSERSEIFKGNDDDINEKNNMFDTLVTARYFKLGIIGSKNPRPGLRMEVFGCYHGYEILPTTPLIPIEDQLESCIKYGPWKSLSDPNLPNSEGDFEKIKDVIDESGLCTNPIGIECQTHGSHISYRQTGQNVTCDLTNGLSCWNKDQRRNDHCYNYEVRIKCWTCPLERNDTDALSEQLHCPELPRFLANNCPVCSNELRCNGTSCVDESSCPCIRGNKVFQMGYKIITKNCEECICSFGGHSTCHKKVCNLCKPEEKPVLLPDCSCSCESCKQGEKMCITNKQCILERQWCDGIEDCPDDELNCLGVSVTPSESEATTGPPAELEKGTCELLGKRIRTVDGQELDYEICDHVVFLDALNKNFNVTVKKTCSQNPLVCHKIYIIQQDETLIKIDNDVKVTINGNNYTASQLTVLNKQNSNITVEIVGNHVIVKSKTYGFTVIRDQRANLKVEMSPEMKNKTIGLCGLYNGKALDDKKKPDGSIATTSKEFGDSWANKDSKECAISNCSSEFGEKALEICKSLREDPFDICKDYLNLESYVQACVGSTCECMTESEDKISECKCAAFLPLLEACENKLHIPLPKWRSKHGCAPSCPLGFVWEDCGNGCQLTCDNTNIQEQTCLETCVAGCFCPGGTVLDGEKCVLPEECSNAMCQGFGDPHFSTFDGLYYPFQAAGQFVLATDKRNSFSVEGKSGKCSPNGNETCLSALTINYNNTVVNIRKGKPIVIGSKPVTMEMLPMQLNGITVLGFPGQVYLVIIPALGIVVRYYEINDGFSINIPSERFYNSTRGLCGNCNGQKNDEMIPAYSMIINTTSDFVCSWVKEESFTECKKSFHEKSLVSMEDKCPEILDSTFEPCHALVDPTIYQTSCNYDVAYSTDRHAAICKTLMEYSRKCCEAGIMLSDWFNKYNCDIPCPNGTVFHHCHDACPQTCQNTSETINCHDYKIDGCFCSENKVLKDGVCVDEVYCKLPQGCTYTLQYGIDSKGKEFLLPPDKRNSSLYKVGETWQDGLCHVCTCEENNGLYIPYCAVTECPNYKNLADNLDYEIVSLPSSGTCCPKLYYTSCKDEDGNLMKIGEKWQNKTDPCKEFQCEFSPEGQASKILKDVKCECNEGEEEQPPAENHCCGECIKKYCVANNMHYSTGEHWVYSKCYMAECIEENGQANLRLYDNCSQVSESCPTEHIIRDQSGCCDICNTTLGAVGCNTITKDMKTGEFEHEYEGHGKCRNPNPLDAVMKCSGLCESESMYYLENGEVASACKCCSPVDIQIRDIVLKCDDNTLQKFQLKEPKACRCSPCAASAKNKGKTNPSKKGGSGDQQYEKHSNQNQQFGQEYDSENEKQFHDEGNVNNGQNFVDDDI